MDCAKRLSGETGGFPQPPALHGGNMLVVLIDHLRGGMARELRYRPNIRPPRNKLGGKSVPQVIWKRSFLRGKTARGGVIATEALQGPISDRERIPSF